MVEPDQSDKLRQEAELFASVAYGQPALQLSVQEKALVDDGELRETTYRAFCGFVIDGSLGEHPAADQSGFFVMVRQSRLIEVSLIPGTIDTGSKFHGADKPTDELPLINPVTDRKNVEGILDSHLLHITPDLQPEDKPVTLVTHETILEGLDTLVFAKRSNNPRAEHFLEASDFVLRRILQVK